VLVRVIAGGRDNFDRSVRLGEVGFSTFFCYVLPLLRLSMNIPPSSAFASRHGYTMVELVVVVLILGILAGVAAPTYFDSLAVSRSDAAAKRVVADLNLVRARAIMKGPSVLEAVYFFPASDTYVMAGDPSLNDSSVEYQVDLSETSYPVDLVSTSFTNTLGANTTSTVAYDLHGIPHSGDSPVAPLLTGQIVVASGSHQRTVVIDPVTGKASVQ